MITASIPSPPYEWQSFNVGELLRSWGATWATWDLTIHAYALWILLGIIVGLVITNRRLTARGVEPWLVLDVALLAVPLGIVGGRAYHVITHPGDYFAGQDLVHVLYVWEGGMAIFGALVLGAAGAWMACRIAGLRFVSLLDAIAPGLLVAQALGRLGNYFNHELFGGPTDLPWGLEIESSNPAFPVGLTEGTLFHPTFLYESLWNLIGAVVLVWAGKKFTLQWGRTFAFYLVWYGAGRVAVESLRLDPSESFLGLRVNVWAAIGALVLGIVLDRVQRRRHVGLEPNAYVPGRGWTSESSVESKNTYTAAELAVDADSVANKSRATSTTH